jgi:hypothetical protein
VSREIFTEFRFLQSLSNVLFVQVKSFTGFAGNNYTLSIETHIFELFTFFLKCATHVLLHGVKSTVMSLDTIPYPILLLFLYKVT